MKIEIETTMTMTIIGDEIAELYHEICVITELLNNQSNIPYSNLQKIKDELSKMINEHK